MEGLYWMEQIPEFLRTNNDFNSFRGELHTYIKQNIPINAEKDILLPNWMEHTHT